MTYGEHLMDLRKQFIAERDEMLAFQKQFSADREAARFFKEEARDRLKLYRAVCSMIPAHVADPPKDCPVVYGFQPVFPKELEYARIVVDAIATTRTYGPVKTQSQGK